MNKLIILLLAICAIPLFSNAQSVIRGPYLQSAGSDHITIKWRTDQPTSSGVNIGSSPNFLPVFYTDSVLRTDHEIKVSNLDPSTVYYYNIVNANSILVPAADDLYFKTHPALGVAGDYKFWVLGDCGTGNDNQRSVRDAYYDYIGTDHTDGILFLGDNAYERGTDDEYQGALFENMYEDKLQNSVAWSTLGNHDGLTANSISEDGPYYDIFTFPTNGESGGVASATEAYYSFDYGNIHFICLESNESDRNVGSTMYNWCQADIQSTNQEWIIAFWHHPAYTKGSHDSDNESQLIDMRENFLPMLEDNGVDLVLSGHSHSYERSFFINGHYSYSNTFDPSQHIVGENGRGDGSNDGNGAYSRTSANPNDGTVYITAGSSGKISTGFPLDHEAMFYGEAALGSCALEVNGDKLDLKFIHDDGSILDYFTITKSPLTCTAGTPCDDNDASTINDVYNSSCGCFGTSIVDSDGDGIVDSEDCNPNNVQYPGIPGTSCDDGNSMTENDVIQPSGCSCLGTQIIGCDVVVSVSNNTITISGLNVFENAKIFNTDWQILWTCNPWQEVCSPSESFVVDDGTYFVSGGFSECDFFQEVIVPGIACTDQDNDGICADLDCNDNNANLPATVGTSCDDGNALTANDVIQSDGCACLGEEIACVDNDEDGICAEADCDDNNANLPTTVGSSCDDGDALTTNDVIQADGCACMGVPTEGCNITATSSDGVITITGAAGGITKIFSDNWEVLWECNPWSNNPCTNLETYLSGPGLFYVSSQAISSLPNTCDFFMEINIADTECIDTDSDEVCDTEDCQPNNPNLPTTPGSPCIDGDSETTNDVIQSDGCTCLGTPIDPVTDCAIGYTIDTDMVTFTGLTDAIVTVSLYGPNFNLEFGCGTWSVPCSATEVVSNLSAGKYRIVYESFNAAWEPICSANEEITVDQNAAVTTNLNGIETNNSFHLYPNPAENILNIDLSNFKNKLVTVEIFDMFGKKMTVNSIKKTINASMELDLSNFKNGVFNLSILVNNQYLDSRKFVVVK